MRLITLALTALLLLIQIPLWLGKGGWLRVADMRAQVGAAQQKNTELQARNDKLDSEVRDLKEGTGAVEERARFELNMVKQNEIFVQIVDKSKAGDVNRTPSPPPFIIADPHAKPGPATRVQAKMALGQP